MGRPAWFSRRRCTAFVHVESQGLIVNPLALVSSQPGLANFVEGDWMMKPKDFFDFAKTNKCEMIDLKFVDMLGTWQHCSYPIEEFDEGTFADGVGIDG